MRIVAGKHRGRNLVVPRGHAVRPTSDRGRESLFNLLSHGDYGQPGPSIFIDAVVVDAFAGSGALGLEALSRGAAKCTFIENARDAQEAITANIETFGETETCHLIKTDVLRLPRAQTAANLVFLDPPYAKDILQNAFSVLVDRGWIDAQTLCCAEMAVRENFDEPTGFKIIDDRHYGRTRFVLLQRNITEN